ncbi:MAG: proline racemase family protein [Planctomycetota bacterium]
MSEPFDSEPIRFVDSHTEGEPTRLIVSGGPKLVGTSLAEQREAFRKTADEFRHAVLSEPRGYDAMVGALLCEPIDPECAAGVIFFNNAGYLNMCGHGAIGVTVSLHHLGRIELGRHKIETPVGNIEVQLHTRHQVSIDNVPSYRLRRDVEIQVDGLGLIVGDVAWGGNWFFLTKSVSGPLTLDQLDRLTESAKSIRRTLRERGISGADGAEIDHIELMGGPESPTSGARNFVLCPGSEYDRSPCGTGTSAKVACLAEDGQLAAGEIWVQESVIGSRFDASYRRLDPHSDECHAIPNGVMGVVPTITGRAYLCSEGTIYRQESDPFRNGIDRGLI